MDNENNFNLNSLVWVKQEIDVSLNAAREHLQQYIAQDADAAALEMAQNQLKDALGTLHIAELNGPSLLADEIQLVLQAMQDGVVKHAVAAARPVIRAMVQLSDYLDYIEANNPDLPIVLVAVINELRLLRREKLLSDEIIAIPGLAHDAAVLAQQPHSDGNMAVLAKAGRTIFEVSLLGWYRNQNPDTSLEKMAMVCRRLRDASNHSQGRRFWWVSEAIILAVRHKALASTQIIKQLIGRIDRQLKQLQSLGEEGFAQQLAPELIKTLLYYVGTAHAGNATVDEVCAVYFLQDGEQSSDPLSATQISLSGQNSEGYQRLSLVVQEKLLDIKTQLDAHAQDKGQAPLSPVVVSLKELQETLKLLGMRHQANYLQQHSETLRMAIEQDDAPRQAYLLSLAESLLGVEAAVQAFSVLGREFVIAAERRANGESSDNQIEDEEFRTIRAGVVKESIASLEETKLAIQAYAVGDPQNLTMLDGVPEQLRQISGAMLLVSLNPVAGLVERASKFIQARYDQGEGLDSDELEQLAEALAGVDVYLDMLDTNGTEQDEYIEKGDAAMARLLDAASRGAVDEKAELPLADVLPDAEDDPDTMVFDLDMDELSAAVVAPEADVEEAPPRSRFSVSIIKHEKEPVAAVEAAVDDTATMAGPIPLDTADTDLETTVNDEPGVDEIDESPTLAISDGERIIKGIIADADEDLLRSAVMDAVADEDDEFAVTAIVAEDEIRHQVTENETLFPVDGQAFSDDVSMHNGVDEEEISGTEEFSQSVITGAVGGLPDFAGEQGFDDLLADSQIAAADDDASLSDADNTEFVTVTGLGVDALQMEEGIEEVADNPENEDFEIPATEMFAGSFDDLDLQGDEEEVGAIEDDEPIAATASILSPAATVLDFSDDSVIDVLDDGDDPSLDVLSSQALTSQLEDPSLSELELNGLSTSPSIFGELDADETLATLLPETGWAGDESADHDSHRDADDLEAGGEQSLSEVPVVDDIDLLDDGDWGDAEVEDMSALLEEAQLGDGSTGAADALEAMEFGVSEVDTLVVDVPSEEITLLQERLESELGSLDSEETSIDQIEFGAFSDLETQMGAQRHGPLTLVDILPEDELDEEGHGFDDHVSSAAEFDVEEDEDFAIPAAFTGLVAVAENADEEIFQIFLEEFAEESALLAEAYPAWRENPGNRDTLFKLRRAFHTLKGSARLVGAEVAGEYAWLHENMLSQLADGQLPMTNERVSVIGSGIALLPNMLQRLRQRKGLNAQAATQAQQLIALAQTQANSPSASEVLRDETSTMSVDPVLIEIFAEEAQSHLNQLDLELSADWDGKRVDVHDALFRAIHTLTGSAKTANIPEIYNVCQEFERYLSLKAQLDEPLDEKDKLLLERLRQHVVNVLDGLGETQVFPIPEELVADVKALAQQLETGADQPLGDYTEMFANTVADTLTSSIELGDAAEPELQHEVTAELVEVFLSECEEILTQTDAAMQRWQQAPDDMAPVRELQRELHTLKGSARMANLPAIGDLSHSMETLLAGVDDGDVVVDKNLFTVVFSAFDQFGVMSETVSRGEIPVAADGIIALMQKLQAGEALNDSDFEQLKSSANVQTSKVVALEANATLPTPEPAVTLPFESRLADLMPLREGGAGEVLQPRLQDSVKVNPELLDQFVDSVGEVKTLHSRLEQIMSGIGFNLQEYEQTVRRLTDQLRQLEMEAGAKVAQQFDGADPDQTGLEEKFDPLELDRYSKLQQLSRSLAESTNDLQNIHQLLSDERRDVENLLQQQSRVSNNLREQLISTRMSAFAVMLPRLRRVVRSVALELDKEVELNVSGDEHELDRKVLEGIIVPLEHLLRNALAHGIEAPAQREALGKPRSGHIKINVSREGPEVIIEVADDGAGIDKAAVFSRAIEQGIIEADAALSDNAIHNLILQPGFSTATEVSQVSGRGVGMDVVQEQLKLLNGMLEIHSEPGNGTGFKLSLPFTMAITQSLLVSAGDATYAVPISAIEGVIQMPSHTLIEKLNGDSPSISYADTDYLLHRLDEVLESAQLPALNSNHRTLPILLVGSAEQRLALVVEEIRGNHDVVVKSLGSLLNNVPGLGGATILGDGRLVLILDVPAVIRNASRSRNQLPEMADLLNPEPQRSMVMVVDDSITIRRVTEKMLERHHYQVITAKDGLDAVTKLEDVRPDIMLLDIEMPRMDGFELAAHMQGNEETRDIPLVMISSRTGKKHRERAIGLGVREFLGKPYQDSELLETIEALLKPSAVDA
jgi:chemosensory pili system protein ChpA (sensor histidine kinase/response regulator)